MSGSSEASSSPGATPDFVDEAFKTSQAAFDSGLKSTVGLIRCGINLALKKAGSAQVSASEVFETGQAHLDTGVAHYQAAEDQVFGHLKDGLRWGIANPYIAYPASGLGLVLLLPGTRRLLYRMTIGAMRNPESIRQASEGRVTVLRTQLEDYSKEALKLQVRMTSAEEEMLRGLTKLKATRAEFERLHSVVEKGEHSATGVLRDLRSIHKLDAVSALRGEAATQLSGFRAQRRALEKSIYKLAKQGM